MLDGTSGEDTQHDLAGSAGFNAHGTYKVQVSATQTQDMPINGPQDFWPPYNTSQSDYLTVMHHPATIPAQPWAVGVLQLYSPSAVQMRIGDGHINGVLVTSATQLFTPHYPSGP